MIFPSQALHLGLWLGQSCLFLSSCTYFSSVPRHPVGRMGYTFLTFN